MAFQKKMHPKYSICMLCFNDSKNLKASIASLIEFQRLRQAEIIVVDNCSTDGSWEMLKDYRATQGIICLRKKCTRGAGRQLGLSVARGEYVLGQMDCDDVYSPSGLDSLLNVYHEKYDGNLMMTTTWSNITMGPRSLIIELGGWRDLNWWEEWDLWARAASKSKYRYHDYPKDNPPYLLINDRDTQRKKNFRARVFTGYQRYRDAIRIGKPTFGKKEHVSPLQKAICLCAKTVVALKGSKLEPVPNPEFKRYARVEA